MPEITVWTKQNKAVLNQLNAKGRFIADESFIRRELEDTADIMLFIYRWLADNMPAADRPDDVLFPVWVSFEKEATMFPEPGYAVLELRVDSDKVTKLDIAKWTRITNYAYIPADKADEAEHKRILEQYGTDNASAVMTQFWPELKRKIIDSWSRLFDDSIVLGSTNAYGLMWEVRKEWIRTVIQ
ncbi:MAG: DUF3841 domain-containing protein [Mogibacterium sp.]|nr:DUF3841 domain-containing protein [Mogibacterium sp.]